MLIPPLLVDILLFSVQRCPWERRSRCVLRNAGMAKTADTLIGDFRIAGERIAGVARFAA